ncbi:MAG: NAD(P)H-binding protein [Ottowia sp.]|nr:NAD(P)H-binding protein [Ottowia sp.]
MSQKVLILGANGKSGSALVEEALRQGHEVTAVARKADYANSAVKKVIHKDILELTKEDLSGFDAVISAFAAWTPETFPLHKKVAEHLCSLLAGTPTRLLVVGGAGTLYTDESLKTRVMDTPAFPAAWQGVAKATAESFDVLKASSGVRWTYVSPAGDYDANGRRSGAYELGGDVIKVNSKGESYISYADLAIAIIDEVKNGAFINKRFTAVGER